VVGIVPVDSHFIFNKGKIAFTFFTGIKRIRKSLILEGFHRKRLI